MKKGLAFVYIAEFNRTIDDNIRLAARRLIKLGLDVEVLAHKTSLIIRRPLNMSWSAFKDAIRSVLKPRIGSVLINSKFTNKTYFCSNRGNQPGRFQFVA